MNLPIRNYRLSDRKGEGIQCDSDGVFVGSVPLLKWSDRNWQLRDSIELSEQLSETYGLPVDFVVKTEALSALARALNDGDIARAQLIGLHLQLPEPIPLAKNAPSQSDVDALAGLLEFAGVLKINYRHYPARTSDHKGAQFAPKDGGAASTSDQKDGNDPTANLSPPDDPRRDQPRAVMGENEAVGENATRASSEAITEAETRAATRAEVKAAVRATALSAESKVLRVATRRLFREAAVEALERIGSKLALNEIPIVGLVADLATVYDVYRFVREFAELRAAIKAATRFVNEGTHTLAQLRVSTESRVFQDYDQFVKVWDTSMVKIELEKRFGPAGEGFQYHHIIERNSGTAGGNLESTDNIIRIPTILHQEVTRRFV